MMANDIDNKDGEGPTAGERLDTALEAIPTRAEAAEAAKGAFGRVAGWGRAARRKAAAVLDPDNKEGGE